MKFVNEQDKLSEEIARASRAYLKYNKVYRYRMKKINDMNDEEVIQKCHWWCEEHGLVEEYRKFEETEFNIEKYY